MLEQGGAPEDLPQRVHVGIWYILRAQRGSHIPTLRPKYIPYTYIDPLGSCYGPVSEGCHSICGSHHEEEYEGQEEQHFRNEPLKY